MSPGARASKAATASKAAEPSKATRAADAGTDAVAPDVTVVVVNYNSGDDLTRCLRSIHGSAGKANVEVIAVDNASVDGSADLAVGASPRSHLIRNRTNRGFGAAANQGMRAARAPFVFLLNPDAVISAGTLDGFLKVAGDKPRAGVIGCLTKNPDGTVYPSARKVPSITESLVHSFLAPFVPDNRWSRSYTMAGWDRHGERQVGWVSGSSMLLRRDALDAVGIFDEGYFMYVEDVDLCTRMRDAGWQVWFSPALEVEHVVGSVTKGSRRMTLEHSKSIYRYYMRHSSPGALAFTRPFAWVAVRARAALVSWKRGDR